MPSPFPGMDPYLEHPDLWPDVHTRLAASLGDHLVPLVSPRYYVALEERTYLDDTSDLVFVGRPDVALVGAGGKNDATRVRTGARAMVLEVEVPIPDRRRETYLEVRGVGSGEVVTVIELLSPANKHPGRGRRVYLRKRRRVLGTRTNLVEIDLLRGGERMPTLGSDVETDYRILVSRRRGRPRADLIVFGVRDPIPPFSVPLRPGEDEPTVELSALVAGLYDRARYDLRIDYRRLPVPPLTGADAAWADEILRSRRAQPAS